MTRFFTIALAIASALLGLTPGEALAERRVALIVGNSNYSSVPRLPNPSRDASAVATMFKSAGFETIETHLDVGNLDFKRAIRRFEDTAADSDVAVLYYAGHGLEIGGTNYLIPVDARLASDRDAPDEAIPIDRLVSSADSAKKLRLIILDACRDNPYANKMRRESRAALRAVSAGLGKIEPSSTDTLIAYAAKAGSTAEDGDGSHSPFTAALLKHLTVPGLDLRLAFGRVKDEVMKTTSGRQEPYVYGSLGGGIYSLVPAPVEIKGAATSVTADVKGDYELVEKIGSRRAWEVFLGTHKSGFYADLAREQLAKLPNLEADRELLAKRPETVSLGPPVAARPAGPSTRELLDWEKIKDSGDIPAIRNFIRRYPDSTLAIAAHNRLDVLEQAAREREAVARAAREEAERKRAEEAAAKRREEEERRAMAAEAAQRAKAAEAERQAAEMKRRMEDAVRLKTAAEAERLRLESERAAREAEAERKKAELAAAQEAVCKADSDRFDLVAKGTGTGADIDALRRLSKEMTCDRIKPQVAAKLGLWTSNTPDLIKAAQTELARINCYTGTTTGVMSDATRSGLVRYLAVKKRPASDVKVTEELVAELSKQTSLTCPTVCPAGHAAQGAVCVAAKPAPAKAARREEPRRETKRREEPKQQQRQQASNSGGGRAVAPMIGVGF